MNRKKQLWTFKVHGGERMLLQPKGNIPEEHDGKRSLMRFVLTEEEAESTEWLLQEHGCTVEKSTVQETKEQREERKALAGVLSEDTVFPSVECPMCIFFDPFVEDHCGVSSWPSEMTEYLLEYKTKAKEDLVKCPLEKSVGPRD